ncbi:MAG: IS200/IS605 family transposase [Lachnospiraceae bacterium]|nr:IS200/IS605 family transposase [Lachnospiraceae bacterium]
MKRLSEDRAYLNYYHFIGATKYRKNMFYSEEIRTKLKEIIEEVIERKEGVELVESTVAYNHVHVLVRTELLPSQVGQMLFGTSSRLIRKEFPILVEQVEKGLWGGKSWEPIKDEDHLKNCISYIQRHQPDNTKV